MSYMLAGKRTRSWDVLSKSPAAGLDGEEEHVLYSGAEGLFYTMGLGEKDASCFERIYFGYGRAGKGKVGSSRMGAQSLRKT